MCDILTITVKKMEKLSGDYIAGFVDGEGCFALKLRREIRYERKNKPTYIYWDAEFAIVLREDDKEILKKRHGKILSWRHK